MSFNVNLYNFTKKYNSTAQPAGSGTQFSCVIKEPSGILNPTIVLDLGLTSSPASYNYAYISAFNRYYYIREWNFERGLWLAELEVDVLATYKTTIGASSLYMLRASNEKNGTVIDNLYPCKTGCDFVSTAITSPYDSTGCYVIGVVNKAGMYGSISYYALTRGNMATLLNGLLTDVVGSGSTPLNGFDLSDASLELQLSIVDPIQYIKSAIWLPVPVSNITSDQTETDLNVFNWTIPGVTAYRVSNPSIILRNNIALTNHPDYSARGSYVNSKPYTLATLFMPPFGVIELDTSVTCNAASIDADIYLDANTGEGNLVISANGIVINKLDAKVGVPIQIAQVARDYLGAVTSVANVIGGVMSGGAAGIAGAVAGGISAVGNAINSVTPRSNTIGSSGNFSVLTAKAPELDLQFFRPVDDDNTHNGRPLCAIRTVSTLGGYMLVQDGDVPINGTKQEAEEVQRFLESGFYYE